MDYITNLLIRTAVEISSVIGDKSDTLLNLASSFLKHEYDLNVPESEIIKIIDNSNEVRLFFDYGKDKPEKIKHSNFIKKIARDIWLNNYIAENGKNLTVDNLLSVIEDKFQEEKKWEPGLKDVHFGIFYYVKKNFKNDRILKEYYYDMKKIKKYFPIAYSILENYFKNTDCSYTTKLYTISTANDTDENTEQKEDFKSNDNEKENNLETDSNNNDENIVCKTVGEEQSSYEQSRDISELKTQIHFLEKLLHDRNIKLEFAHNDIVRDVLNTLVDNSFGSPLNELYLLTKDKTTPHRISSIISNLFLALESMNVRLVKEKQVGLCIQIDEETQKSYNPMDGEEISLEDTVFVKYPGYRFGKEVIIRPTIHKEVQQNEAR